MSTRATATAEVKGWDEETYEEFDGGAKLNRAHVTNAYQGDIEGEGKVELLMMYPDENSASYVGLERIVGRVGDRRGSFVLQHSGTYENGAATTTWSVVPGSGTEELRGLRGEGGFSSTSQQYPVTLDYSFE